MTFARGSTCCGFMSKGAASLILPYANWTAMLRDVDFKNHAHDHYNLRHCCCPCTRGFYRQDDLRHRRLPGFRVSIKEKPAEGAPGRTAVALGKPRENSLDSTS